MKVTYSKSQKYVYTIQKRSEYNIYLLTVFPILIDSIRPLHILHLFEQFLIMQRIRNSL